MPLREGSSLILFPEGTRGDGDTPGPFRAGIYHVAREVNEAEFVPVLLNNLNRILPKGEILIVPVIGSVHFGPPVVLTPDENRRDFLDRLRASLLELREA
jgi:1-acyl-sn-glycerol-3-phosphate acyltransferase